MAQKGVIDFDSPIPYYIQLMEIMREKINQKEWQEGDQVPGEKQLCEIYGVSRTVIRQALRELELEGSVTRRRGKGTFISLPKINEGLVQKLTGFYQDMVERGHVPVSQVLHQEVVPASEEIAQFLNIPVKTDVIDIKRLRFIDDEPLQLVTTYIPYALCPALATVDLTNRSLYAYLESCGIFLSHGIRYIGAVQATKSEAQLLNIEYGDPLLLLDSVTYDKNDKPIEYYHAVHRGDRTRFEVELIRTRERNSMVPEINTPFTAEIDDISEDPISAQ